MSDGRPQNESLAIGQLKRMFWTKIFCKIWVYHEFRLDIQYIAQSIKGV